MLQENLSAAVIGHGSNERKKRKKGLGRKREREKEKEEKLGQAQFREMKRKNGPQHFFLD